MFSLPVKYQNIVDDSSSWACTCMYPIKCDAVQKDVCLDVSTKRTLLRNRRNNYNGKITCHILIDRSVLFWADLENTVNVSFNVSVVNEKFKRHKRRQET